jgi:hypothetical protein
MVVFSGPLAWRELPEQPAARAASPMTAAATPIRCPRPGTPRAAIGMPPPCIRSS